MNSSAAKQFYKYQIYNHLRGTRYLADPDRGNGLNTSS